MSPFLPPGDYQRPLPFGGRERSYRFHVPPAGETGNPLPVVLGLHGGASNGRAFSLASGLSDKADAASFVAVYPDGTGQREKLLAWNAGNCCGYARDEMVDDVGFVRAVLDDLATVVPVDSDRVFATGLSNGAMLSYRLAAEMADRIAAIAPVAGPMALDACRPSRPVSVIHLHGTEDQFTPLEGGVGRRSVSRTQHASVATTIQAWVAADGCPPEPIVAQLPPVRDDGTQIVRYRYGPGREGSEVELYIIHGGGHTWPARKGNTFLFGKSTENLIANDVIWDFFQRHPRVR
jgi:polyhydroxybutyrate depolymerase